ncbi:hypothetical protein JD844_028981 [Phrynosoma platyrhinos]|uniref:BPTI/Kunitz inhibitor domain-containing protein n=1 Tax=Phrynosoma platyrhinos TaxID=52577 RepID=A0ABQ7SIM3_PHRPL|nr:hypothetical protein JD844_028981 [Phrynosoma platyrhinos]
MVVSKSLASLNYLEGLCPLADPCVLPMDEGACKRYTVLWYYHREANNCRPFIFGGCGGNANQFPSKQTCERWCKRATVQSSPVPFPFIDYFFSPFSVPEDPSQDVDQIQGERDNEKKQKSAISKTVHTANGIV